MRWFLYDNGPRHERVKECVGIRSTWCIFQLEREEKERKRFEKQQKEEERLRRENERKLKIQQEIELRKEQKLREEESRKAIISNSDGNIDFNFLDY